MAHSEDDIRWAYQYYLGRPPESPEVIEKVKAAVDLKAMLYSGGERMRHGPTYYAPDEFCCLRDGRPRIVVLSSCQGPALARAMSAMADVSVLGFAVIKTRNAGLAHHLMRMMEAADHVIIANFSENWGDFSQEALRKKLGDKVLTYNRPFFEAVHPDLTYIDPTGPKSPLGDYHSRLIIDSFRRKMSQKECLDRFCGEEYQRVGFGKIAERAIAKLKAKDTEVDIGLADLILDNMARTPLFYTVNHPTTALQNMLAARVLERLGIPVIATPPTLLTPTELSNGVIWPIDADWAKIMGFEYHTDAVYWHSNYVMTREELIWRSYNLYKAADPAKLGPELKLLNKDAA